MKLVNTCLISVKVSASVSRFSPEACYNYPGTTWSCVAEQRGAVIAGQRSIYTTDKKVYQYI